MMKQIRNLALSLGLALSTAGVAQAANVLVVLSDSDHLDLKDGKVFQRKKLIISTMFDRTEHFADLHKTELLIRINILGG